MGLPDIAADDIELDESDDQPDYRGGLGFGAVKDRDIVETADVFLR